MLGIKAAIERARCHAPYLAESLALYPDLETDIISRPPEKIIADLFAGLPKLPEKSGLDFSSNSDSNFDAEMARLRQLKRRAHLVIALADIAQIWDWITVTETLTQLADVAMQRLLFFAAQDAGIEGIVNNPVPGLFVLAMGKYGARELNYSSDIDFCVFYDPDIIRLPDSNRAERTLIRLVQALIKGLEKITVDGYIFRTDLRLRPDPRSNAVAVSTLTAERYYETLGQNWERAAMIKARVCAGDQTTGRAFQDQILTPFIWRRHLDYAAIEDIHSIKRQMQSLKNMTALDVAGHHIKLGPGGIREIEFFAQVQQLILGGRHPNLRHRRTVDALRALSAAGFSDAVICQRLRVHYGVLRKFEHCVQMIKDEQTHIAPRADVERTDLARLAGYEDLEAFDADFQAIISDVHRVYNDLFPAEDSLSLPAGNLVFTGVEPDPATLETLRVLGFERREAVWEHMAAWLGGRIAATRSERARELLTWLAPVLIDTCAKTGQPDRAFFGFADFFTQLRAGVSLLAMFRQTSAWLELIIGLLVKSKRIARMLSAQPAVIDVMIDPDFMHIDAGELEARYARLVNPDDDFETVLNTVRRHVHEDQFRVCTSVLSGRHPLEVSGPFLTALANQAIALTLQAARQNVEARYGPITCDYAVLGLGKLGGGELSLSSDLDIMLIYDPQDSEGADAMAMTRLTQRLINGLSVKTAEGALFEVDMALRPSGRSGPVAVSRESFQRYYAEKAWTWEYMAMSRARIVAASRPEFIKTLMQDMEQALCAPRRDLDYPADIQSMLIRTKKEKRPSSIWDVKNSDGGLRDVEYIAQALYLRAPSEFFKASARHTRSMLDRAEVLDLLTGSEAQDLRAATDFYARFNHAVALTGLDMAAPDASDIDIVARIMDFASAEAFQTALKHHRDKVIDLTRGYIGPVFQDG